MANTGSILSLPKRLNLVGSWDIVTVIPTPRNHDVLNLVVTRQRLAIL